MTTDTSGPAMTAENDGPAFPSTIDCGDGSNMVYPGMMLRDYFAAKAMRGMLAHTKCDYSPINDGTAAGVASDAYAIATAMLEARK